MTVKKVQSSDRLIQQMQTNITEVLDPISQQPLVSGLLIKDITLLAGITNIIPTKLNRDLVGWIVNRLDTNSVIWDSQKNNPTPSQNLQLLCSVDCIISLYVF